MIPPEIYELLSAMIQDINAVKRRVENLDTMEADGGGDVGATIHGATEKTTPVDADTMPLIDSAASNALKKVSWANIKATLGTLFANLGVANTWTQAQTIASTTVNSHALGVTRNLDASNTTGAVVILIQDHASDDQAVMALRQDGTGDIITALDGGTTVFRVLADGSLSVTRNLAAASTSDPVANIVQDNAGDDQPALRVQQDGSGQIVTFLDGASEAFAIADGGGVTLPLIVAKTTPVDADGVLLRDSAATSVVKETTWANIKATLKTYFDTLYGLLATANTWTKNQTIASTTTTGNALRVVRDLAAASTDAPVTDIVQDNVGDDQIALRVQQDGTGAVVEAYDGATLVLRAADGGRLDVYNIIRALTASGLRLEDDGGNLGVGVADGGRVGIGTDTPAGTEADSMFTVEHSSVSAMYMSMINTGTGQVGFVLRRTGGTASRWIHYVDGGTERYAIYNGTYNGNVAAFTETGRSGFGTDSPQGKVHIDQASTTAAVPVLILDQADLSEEFIEFTSTVGAGNPIDTAALGSYYGKIRVNITGVGYKYIPLYDS